MGNKFFETPKFTTGDILGTRERFRQELFLKVFFAECESEFSKSKLYIKSEWTPKDFKIPCWTHDRLDNFLTKVTALFKRKRAPSNLLPFQQEIMERITNYHELIFPDTDKGLGPCAIEYSQYVEDCLAHLRNDRVYQRLSDEEATTAISKLSTEIDGWARCACTYPTSHLSRWTIC